MRIRDSKTGKYISEEEANSLTPERYVVEKDVDKGQILEEALQDLLEELTEEAVMLANVPYVNMESVKAVFAKRGL